MNERPHITVATVVESEGRFLLVRELSEALLVYNQPAGHVEVGETLQQAAVRETLEETGWQVSLTAYLGTYQHHQAETGISYVRHCFVAAAQCQQHDGPQDPDIESALWMSREQLQDLQQELRSPMVWRAIEDYDSGTSYPLSIFRT